MKSQGLGINRLERMMSPKSQSKYKTKGKSSTNGNSSDIDSLIDTIDERVGVLLLRTTQVESKLSEIEKGGNINYEKPEPKQKSVEEPEEYSTLDLILNELRSLKRDQNAMKEQLDNLAKAILSKKQ